MSTPAARGYLVAGDAEYARYVMAQIRRSNNEVEVRRVEAEGAGVKGAVDGISMGAVSFLATLAIVGLIAVAIVAVMQIA